MHPAALDSLYSFADGPVCFSKAAFRQGVPDLENEQLLHLLLWYGVLGVRSHGSEEVRYIYSVSYDEKRLQARLEREDENAPALCVNPAFWAGLGIQQAEDTSSSNTTSPSIRVIAANVASTPANPGSETDSFTMLHLSDIHFGHGGAPHLVDQKLVAEGLLEDLRSHSDHTVDALIVTGDVASTGGVRTADEYAIAWTRLDPILESVGLNRTSAMFVAGNHDVNRSVANEDRDVRRMVESMRASVLDLDEGLSYRTDRHRLEARLAAFTEFTRGTVSSDIFWVHAPKPWLTIVGLNSALLSQDDSDAGNLALGKSQLQLLPERAPGRFVVALTHHPLSWLRDHDEAAGWFERRVDLHLHGHLHEANLNALQSASGSSILRIASGAFHRGPKEPPTHGYSVVRLAVVADGDLAVRVWPRIWSAKSKRFVVDTENTATDSKYAQFTLAPYSRT